MNEEQAERIIRALERVGDFLENLQVSIDSIDTRLEQMADCVVDLEGTDESAIQIWNASE